MTPLTVFVPESRLADFRALGSEAFPLQDSEGNAAFRWTERAGTSGRFRKRAPDTAPGSNASELTEKIAASSRSKARSSAPPHASREGALSAKTGEKHVPVTILLIPPARLGERPAAAAAVETAPARKETPHGKEP